MIPIGSDVGLNYLGSTGRSRQESTEKSLNNF